MSCELSEGAVMSEKTLAIIKPDAVKKNIMGKIIQRIEDEGFKISAMKMISLTKDDARGFYVIHKEKPFYNSLTDFMSSGPVVVMTLERENAIAHWRQVMGATDSRPSQARHSASCPRIFRGKECCSWIGRRGNSGVGNRIFF